MTNKYNHNKEGMSISNFKFFQKIKKRGSYFFKILSNFLFDYMAL